MHLLAHPCAPALYLCPPLPNQVPIDFLTNVLLFRAMPEPTDPFEESKLKTVPKPTESRVSMARQIYARYLKVCRHLAMNARHTLCFVVFDLPCVAITSPVVAHSCTATSP